MRVLAIGRPTVIGAPRSTRARVDHTVVSVGPYAFQRIAQRSRSWPASVAFKASPPLNAASVALPLQPLSISICHVAGVACMKVTPESSTKRPSRRPSETTSVGAMTIRAPLIRASQSSGTDMSKDVVVIARTASVEAMPGSRAIDVRRFTTDR